MKMFFGIWAAAFFLLSILFTIIIFIGAYQHPFILLIFVAFLLSCLITPLIKNDDRINNLEKRLAKLETPASETENKEQ